MERSDWSSGWENQGTCFESKVWNSARSSGNDRPLSSDVGCDDGFSGDAAGGDWNNDRWWREDQSWSNDRSWNKHETPEDGRGLGRLENRDDESGAAERSSWSSGWDDQGSESKVWNDTHSSGNAKFLSF